MNINYEALERLAREICDTSNGAGHYDAKGTKRGHWRKLAYADMERAHGLNTLDALIAILGLRRVEG